jgi:hypothetical protein
MAEDLTGVGTTGPTDVELPRGLALNSVRVICGGEHLVTRFVKPHNYSSEWRRALEAEIGQAVFVGDEFAYASGEINHPKGGVTTVGCDAESGELCVFALRHALVRHARDRGFEAWINAFREVTIAGLLPVRKAGDVIVEPLLVTRVLREGFETGEVFLTVRPRSRSYLAGSLATRAHSENFIGETAHRLRGDGPARAKIAMLEASGQVKLVARNGDETSWPSDDYSVVATPELIRIHFGPQAWANVQVATGTLTQTKRRNTYAVKDRFIAASTALTKLGPELELPGVAVAIIEREWSEVRIEEMQ